MISRRISPRRIKSGSTGSPHTSQAISPTISERARRSRMASRRLWRCASERFSLSSKGPSARTCTPDSPRTMPAPTPTTAAFWSRSVTQPKILWVALSSGRSKAARRTKKSATRSPNGSAIWKTTRPTESQRPRSRTPRVTRMSPRPNRYRKNSELKSPSASGLQPPMLASVVWTEQQRASGANGQRTKLSPWTWSTRTIGAIGFTGSRTWSREEDQCA